ncbi:Fc receptor-like protein 5 [Peromyscus californicus insignis]|uniref:Fc receptor-like protein 5 n=1 Tax=Peromyscus californicus insignis TaxID=564181 RepID=UPI0022A73B4D|nr:Fc receptor-like protein 5 [Peromyscus californicus insignis]
MPGSVCPWVVFTLLWLALPVVTPVRRQYETATKSVISLNPPWTAFFQGEKVTLTCYRYGFKLPQKTKWYQNGKELREITVHTFMFSVSGEYQCQADDLHLSISVHLHFDEGPLVLRAPPAVFEGETVTLRCHAKENIAQKTLTFYKNYDALKPSGQRSQLFISHANPRDNGVYHCSRKKEWLWSSTSSNSITIQVQELFPRPVLRARPSQPIDGSPVTLTCQTQLPAQRSNVQLQFCFFRNFQTQALGSGCSSSSELHIPAIWTEDSMSYWCMAETMDAQVRKRSLAIKIAVQRASADFQIHSVPALTSVFEGQLLLFNCSVKGVPGPIKFSWYKRDKLNKETKTPKSSEAEFKISAVNSSDAGDYYCEANNSRRSFVSKAVPVTIKVPVSQPVLTLSTGKTRALEGDLMTLHCRSRRGSPHIRYEFYYEDVFLEINSTLSGGGASFNFSMTTERSGNYYCTADNGLGAQRSEAVRISVIDTTKNRSVTVAAGIAGGLLIVAGAAAGVLFYCWFSRKAGGKPAFDDSRDPSCSEPQEPTYYNVPACIELQPVYSNDPKEEVIYTEVRRTQQNCKHAVQKTENQTPRCQMAE